MIWRFLCWVLGLAGRLDEAAPAAVLGSLGSLACNTRPEPVLVPAPQQEQSLILAVAGSPAFVHINPRPLHPRPIEGDAIGVLRPSFPRHSIELHLLMLLAQREYQKRATDRPS